MSRQSPACFDPDDAIREARRQAELKQKHIQLVDNLHSLKAHYYKEYMEGLTDKIEKQRRDIKRKTEECNRRSQMDQLKKPGVPHHVRIKSSRSSLQHDKSFLENLEKNRLHRICAIESKLLKEGRFRTVEDRDRFWEGLVPDSRDPEQHLPSHGRDGHSHQRHRAPSETSEELNTLPPGDQVTDKEPMAAMLGLIREETEISSAASNRRHRGSVPLQRQKSRVSSSLSSRNPKVEAFKEKFKQVEFPNLSAFTLNLELKREDPADLRLRQGYDHRTRLRRHNSKQLNRMYQMSLVHLAATQRMLDSNDELAAALEGPRLSDVFSDSVPQMDSSIGSQDRSVCVHGSPPSVETKAKQNISRSMAPSRLGHSFGDGPFPNTDDDNDVPDEDSSDGEGISSIRHLPLSLDAVMEKSTVLEAKRPSVFWYNYGKFLPSIVT